MYELSSTTFILIKSVYTYSFEFNVFNIISHTVLDSIDFLDEYFAFKISLKIPDVFQISSTKMISFIIIKSVVTLLTKVVENFFERNVRKLNLNFTIVFIYK